MEKPSKQIKRKRDEPAMKVRIDAISEKYESTKEDLEKWRRGAEKFGSFWEKIKDFKDRIPDISLGCFQAMFLEEKPATWYDCVGFEPQTKDAMEKSIEMLKNFGFKTEGEYIYRPELVKEIVNKNPSIFESFESKEPEKVMRKLVQAKKEELNIPRGVLLGFPLQSAIDFEKLQKLDQATKERNLKSIDIYGVGWIDHGGSSKESLEKQKRLRAAFEKSGILLEEQKNNPNWPAL